MVKSRKITRKTRKMTGGSYGTPAQFFNVNALPPTEGLFDQVVSSAPTDTMIRPVVYSTFQTGGATRRNRKDQTGGFSPSVMGGFIPNAQAAIVPAAFYLIYHTMVPKNGKTPAFTKSLKKLGNRALNSVKRTMSKSRSKSK